MTMTVTTVTQLDLHQPLDVNGLTLLVTRISGQRVRLEIRTQGQPRLRRHARPGVEVPEREGNAC